jgi:hypothetical protein
MTQPTNGTGAPSARERLDRLQRDLAALRGKQNRATLISTIVVALGLLLLGGYLIYGYVTIAAATEPSAVIDAATGLLDQSLPEARMAIQDEVTRSAPEWAAGLSKQAREQMPALRVKLEQLTVDGLDEGVKQVEVLTEQQIKEFFAKNRTRMEEVLRDLEGDPKTAEHALDELVALLEMEMKANLVLQSRMLVDDVASLNRRLERLRANKDLTEEERLERQCVMLARRLQMEHVEPALSRLPEVPAIPGLKGEEKTKSP